MQGGKNHPFPTGFVPVRSKPGLRGSVLSADALRSSNYSFRKVEPFRSKGQNPTNLDWTLTWTQFARVEPFDVSCISPSRLSEFNSWLIQSLPCFVVIVKSGEGKESDNATL
jgi:hypothetical protein